MDIERIIVDPAVLVGKPVVRGTRVSVEVVLEHLARTLDVDDVLRAFPRLTREDVAACIDYARANIAGESVFPAQASR